MRALFVAIRVFFKKGRNNLIKILSLGIGLAMGLVLIAKIYMEQSYDTFFPDADRIYMIYSSFSQQEEEMREFSQVSGAIAPGMKAEIPEIEAATRYAYQGFEAPFFTNDRRKYNGTFILADSCLFDVLPLPVIIGNAKEILARPMSVMVSKEIADKMGGVGSVVGETIEMDSYPGKILTVEGVFQTLPENSHTRYDIIISLTSIGQFSYDGTENWLGNDRYKGYVKLHPGVDPESLTAGILRMQEKNQPMAELEKAGVKLGYSLKPLLELHKGTPETKRMMRLLGLLAFAILFTAVMNYILIVISSLVSRSKEMAVNKCYGASDKNIYMKMLSETFLHLIISLILALILIFAARKQIYDLLDASLGTLFSWQAILVLIAVSLVVFLISGLIPGYLYSRIPVSSAFRNYSENRRFWKLGLLFIQFMAAGFLVTLVVIIERQYSFMLNDNPGYQYENLSYCSLRGVSADERRKAISEIERMAEVEQVSACYQLPFHGSSGNNIYLPNDDRDLFNIADQYNVWNGYLDLMEIPVVEGRSFLENVSSSDEVMVSRSFLDRMANYADWSDGAIGKNILISEHSQNGRAFTICGIYEDFRMGAIGREDKRASVMFYSNNPSSNILIKYHNQTAEANQKAEELLKGLFPDKDIVVISYAKEIADLYSDSRKFRDAVMYGALVALIISLIGLIGYTNDEMSRRRKETAIRKVNGATIWNIQSLFLSDNTRMAIPALVLAGGIAAYVAVKWQDQFSEKITLSPALFVLCGLVVLVVILLVVALNCYKAATENPADTVKSE